MAEVTLPNTLTAGETASAADVMADLNAIVAQVNGNLDATNLADAAVSADQIAEAVAALLGLSTTAGVRRGKSIIATPESRTNTAYGLMTTPDRVQNIVLPTDGLICVAYQATWQSSAAGGARAAVFLGANQLATAARSTTITHNEGFGPTTANVDGVLSSSEQGLFGLDSASDWFGDVTTGQLVGFMGPGGLNVGDGMGGPMYIFAAAGTYDVSVQFRASSGSVTAKNRKLWVWTMGF